jgi:hypothetical protein
MKISNAMILCTARMFTVGIVIMTTQPALAADWFVDSSITTPGSGAGWGNEVAFKHLRDALENPLLADGDVIRVKGATGAGLVYYPDEYWSGSATADTNSSADSFIIDGAVIEGNIFIVGQHTGNISDPDERDPDYLTVLSGEIQQDSTLSNNSYHVVKFLDAQIDEGCTIKLGYADGGGADSNGGGVYCHEATPRIQDCLFIDNAANSTGGELYADDGVLLRVRESQFKENIAAVGGGMARAVDNFPEDWETEPTPDVEIVGCSFDHNMADVSAVVGRGGGAYLIHTGVTNVVSCTFWGNEADTNEQGIDAGGGLTIGHSRSLARIPSNA